MWDSRKVLCVKPWGEALIRENGNVYFCCHSECIGNINDKSFKEVWNSELAQDARKHMLEKKFPKLCSSPSCPVKRNMEVE